MIELPGTNAAGAKDELMVDPVLEQVLRANVEVYIETLRDVRRDPSSCDLQPATFSANATVLLNGLIGCFEAASVLDASGVQQRTAIADLRSLVYFAALTPAGLDLLEPLSRLRAALETDANLIPELRQLLLLTTRICFALVVTAA